MSHKLRTGEKYSIHARIEKWRQVHYAQQINVASCIQNLYEMTVSSSMSAKVDDKSIASESMEDLGLGEDESRFGEDNCAVNI